MRGQERACAWSGAVNTGQESLVGWDDSRQDEWTQPGGGRHAGTASRCKRDGPAAPLPDCPCVCVTTAQSTDSRLMLLTSRASPASSSLSLRRPSAPRSAQGQSGCHIGFSSRGTTLPRAQRTPVCTLLGQRRRQGGAARQRGEAAHQRGGAAAAPLRHPARPTCPPVISLSSASVMSLMLTRRTSVRGMPSILSGTPGGTEEEGRRAGADRGAGCWWSSATCGLRQASAAADGPNNGLPSLAVHAMAASPRLTMQLTALRPAGALQPPCCHPAARGRSLTVRRAKPPVCQAQQRAHPSRAVHQRAPPLQGAGRASGVDAQQTSMFLCVQRAPRCVCLAC